jgi:hypothetical protein
MSIIDMGGRAPVAAVIVSALRRPAMIMSISRRL